MKESNACSAGQLSMEIPENFIIPGLVLALAGPDLALDLPIFSYFLVSTPLHPHIHSNSYQYPVSTPPKPPKLYLILHLLLKDSGR